MDHLVTVGAAFALIAVARLLYLRLRHNGGVRLPPGPPPMPVVGNVHQLPLENQERTFFTWGKTYGDIVFAKFFHKPAIVINSVKVAHELMEKRSANYSDRPPFVLLEEMGWRRVPTQLPYGEIYRKHRKWMQDALMSKEALLSYRPMQQRETYILLAALLQSPHSYVSHIRRHAAALVVEIVYGHKISGLDDEYVLLAEKATSETVEAGSPGSNILGLLVEFFPMLMRYPTWLPGSGFKTKVSETRALVDLLRTMPYDSVKERMAAGVAPPSFVAGLLEEHLSTNAVLSQEDEEDIKGAASAFYAAGTDTTTSTLTAFLLCMVRNPDVFKKAQEEIDRVIGRERLPDFEDRESLPYLGCVMKEVYRWSTPVPLAMPHRSIEDDEYSGYHIPGGSMIIPNVWGMSRNEQVYPSPEEFRPERYAHGISEMDDPSNLVFGFGRRFCPGQQLADGNFYLIASNIIATMNIGKARDITGSEITPGPDFVSGFVRHPKPFTFRIEPRSQEAKVLVGHINSLL